MTDQQHPADRPAVSSTVVLIIVGALLLVGLGGAILIHIIRPDASATYTAQALQFLGFMVTVLTIVYGVNKVSAQVGTVQKQTNGTLTALQEKIAQKDNIIQEQADRLVSLAEKVPPKA
ncbi:membrane protein implicated in regulation of membrane protease activity [Microbacterium proteolyticum]|uniref:hypothetical protein n=1 Tax=Microbacterium proteolyticum TaxID=1572644 RepID=UPI00277F46EF|nr:hypothetical protein [Microbacterium proteolyticum]MDQ1169596.1 membrane protein implicated in regulation of membrane protease activity [Microbacterium proteolyticum]